MNADIHFHEDGSLKETPALDHFAFFGLAPAPTLDVAALETAFFALSRRFHPDFFVSRPVDQQQLSLEKTSALNNAWRVLRDPVARAEYLVELETGVAFGESGETNQVPVALLSEVMDIRERIMDLQMAGDDEREPLLTALRSDIAWARAKQAETDQAIAAIAERWPAAQDRSPLTAELKDVLAQRRYFSGLIREIEKIVER